MSKTVKIILAAAAAVVVVIVLAVLSRSDGPTGAAIPAKISDADRADFIASAIPACKTAAAANPDVVSGAISADALDGYCRCFAERSADAITPDEMQTIVDSKALPPAFQAKSAEITKSCSADYLPQPK